MGLAADVETLRVHFINDYYDGNEDYGRVYLDRLSLRDADGKVAIVHEFEDLEFPRDHWGTCADTRRNPVTGQYDHVELWESECTWFIAVEVPTAGVYDVEIVAWSNGRNEHYGDDGFAKLSIVVDAYVYHEGDTWYRDMRAPGFTDALAPNSDNSAQWLAQKIVDDDRFAEAAVKFWWPALMGNEVAEPPEDEGDADFEGHLLGANAQGAEIARLARGFRSGFKWPLEAQRRSEYNLKDLLVEIVLSKWFRAEAVQDADPLRRVALRGAGAKRLLTPEELARKTSALTGYQWDRESPWGGSLFARDLTHPDRWPSALTESHRILYGGIDSDGITARARDITSVMAGVAKRHAAAVSCPVVMREFFLLPDGERRLFAGVDKHVTEPDAIRNKLVELHDILLGVKVTARSPDVEAAYRLFTGDLQRWRESQDDRFLWWDCNIRDLFYFEGILDGAIVERENEHTRYYAIDWDRVGPFMDGLDWSDPHYTARAWVGVLAYMLMDYRYLYL